MSRSAQEIEIHWLFKATDKGLSCLGIQVFADGDYLVIDSPTGTYLAGHADRGKWRLEHDRYVGQGYVPEQEAKAAGLIAESWNRQPPTPPWVRKRRIARVMGLVLLMILLAGLIWLVAGVVSAEPSGDRATAQDYLAALNRLTSDAPDTSVEDVYSRAARLGEALLSPRSALESMPEVEFQALRRQLPGFVLNRKEVLIARPEPSYFLDLAKRYGQPVDRAFFGLQSRGRPDGVWPVYMQQQTDHSGCTLFGQGKLVDSYRRWRHFRSEFPRRYDPFVAQALADIEEQVARSTCACGDPDSVSTELAEFAAAFPESAVAGAAASRARAVREHRSTIRFNCLSG